MYLSLHFRRNTPTSCPLQLPLPVKPRRRSVQTRKPRGSSAVGRNRGGATRVEGRLPVLLLVHSFQTACAGSAITHTRFCDQGHWPPLQVFLKVKRFSHTTAHQLLPRNWTRKKMMPPCSLSIMSLLMLLHLFTCNCLLDFQLSETYNKCSYPKGLLSLAAERFLGNADHLALGNVAQCLAECAVHFHGL